MVCTLARLLPLALAIAAAQKPQEMPKPPMSAQACHTREELEAWRANAEAHLRSFVPGASQEFALGTLRKDYEKRLAEIEQHGPGPAAAAPPRHAPGYSQLLAEGRPPPDGDFRRYLEAHAGDFQRCTQLRQRMSLPRSTVEFPVLLATADMCHMERDLRIWRSCQLAEVRDHVPEAYRRFVVDVLRAQFEQRLAALAPEGAPPAPLPFSRLAATAPQLPAFLAVAAVCGSEPELRAWRTHELEQIQHVVPKEYRRFAMSSLERTFARRLAQLAGGPAAQQPAAPAPVGLRQTRLAANAEEAVPRPDAPDVALELAGERAGVPHLHLKAALLILCALALPALLSLVGSALAAKKCRADSCEAELAEHGLYLQQV